MVQPVPCLLSNSSRPSIPHIRNKLFCPTTVSNYVSAPNTRGTLDILWSSLFTIFACTWTLQHPNVPEQRNGRDPGWFGDLKWGLNGFYRSTLRMLGTIIAPELIMTAASLDIFEARQDHERIHKYVEKNEVVFTWSLSHIYYANMGGFVIRSTPTSEQKYNDPYHLNCKSICVLLQKGAISELPYIREEEIKDKSKGDMFVKVIAIGQILWSVAQIIARAARRLPVSPLEVGVVAFAVCAIIIHCLYWNKPQRVGVPQTILQYGDEAIPEELLEEINDARDIGRGVGQMPPFDGPLSGAPLSIDSRRDVGKLGVVMSIIISTVGAALFGGIHFFAWNFAFPSRVELILWRYASIYTAATPLFIGLIFIWTNFGRDIDGINGDFYEWISYFAIVALYLLSCVYVVARLFIVVEMFRTLCFLPPGSYVSTWTSNIPHVA